MSDNEIWIQLYVGKDKSGSVFKIRVGANQDIDDLKKAVAEERKDDVGSLHYSKLDVYNPGTEIPLNEGDKLDPGDAVSEHTTSSKNPLRVVAPDLLQHNTSVSC
jgi:Crinkler effector protein N-terminal domain